MLNPVLAEQDDKLDWERLIGPLWDNRWRIVLATVLAAVIGIAYAVLATPIYQATTLVQVEQPNVDAPLLQETGVITIGPVPISQDETALVKSRYMIGKSVDALGLTVRVNQHRFPLVGEGMARLSGATAPTLTFSLLTVPSRMLGEKLTLKALERQRFSLSVDGRELLIGEVGKPQWQGDWGIEVSKLEAEPGTTFTVIKLARQTAIDELRNSLEIAPGSKDSGMMTFRLENEDPQLAQEVLENLTENYLKQNIDQKIAEAERSLAFLRQQLPLTQASLSAAEDQLNLFRQQHDSVDLSLEAKAVLDTLVQLEAQLNELTFKEAEISKLYTREHPAYRALLENRSTLESEKVRLGHLVQTLPLTQQQILRLTREVQVGQQVYLQLMKKQREVSISKASLVGNIRIVDRAETTLKPVKPQKVLIVILAVLVGGVFSAAAVLLRAAFHRGITGSDMLVKRGVMVFGIVPLSAWQQKRNRIQRRRLTNDRGGTLPILALQQPGDLAIEAIRSLRTSLHFAKSRAKNNVLLVCGASPACGKSFTCINLAIVLAQAGQRVLLIDGDMRKGFLHRWLNNRSQEGLSEMLAGQISPEQAIKATNVTHLDFVPRGLVPPNPSELLMHPRLGDFLTGVGQRYDLVVIDTPPTLAVTDAVVIGQHAGVVLLVVHFAVNTLSQVDACLRRFAQNGVVIDGVTLNGVKKNTANETGYYPFAYPSHPESGKGR